MAEYTVWNSILWQKLEINDTFVSEKVVTILRPYILPDDLVYGLKNIFKKEIQLSLSSSEESSLPTTITFVTERFIECVGECVAICVDFNRVTLTLVNLKSGILPVIQKKSYNIDVNFAEQPYLKIYEEISEFVTEFFYEFHLDGKTIPTSFCTDITKKQLNINTAIIPYFNKDHAPHCQKDVKTYFEDILCKEAYKKPLPLPTTSSSKVGTSSTEAQNAIFDTKFLGIENVHWIETDLELCHKILTKMQALVDAEKPLPDVTLEVSNTGIKVQIKGSKEILYRHPLNKITNITQDYADSKCFGYVFGNGMKGHHFFGFRTECKSAEILLVLEVAFQRELTRKMEEELNIKASQVFIELKDFLTLAQKLTSMEIEIPITLEKRVKLVEDIGWWLAGCCDDVVMPSLKQYEESDLIVRIQELYSTAIEMKLAEIEEKEETLKKIAKANKKHLRRKKEIEYKRPDDTRRKKSSLHPNQLKVSQIIKEHVAYFQTLVKNRNHKTEILKDQISKVEEMNLFGHLVEKAFQWLKSYCIESSEDMKRERGVLQNKVEFLISSENSERKNVQIKESHIDVGQQQHLKTVQRKPDQPIFETFDFKIPDRSKEKSEVLQEIRSSKRYFLASLKVRREEVEQLNCFISELYLKTDRICYEESNAVAISRKILVKAVKMRLREIKNIEKALKDIHILQENLTYAVPHVLQFCKTLYDDILKYHEVKINQLQAIISRIPESSKMNVSEINLCKEVYFDAISILRIETNAIQEIIDKLQAEENALDINVSSVCSALYSDIIEKRKYEFDGLLMNLDLLDKARMNDLDKQDTMLISNLREAFLASIVVREKEIELLREKMIKSEGFARKDSKVIVRMKDLFCSALELEKRYYEKILLKKTKEEKVLPIIYPLKDLFDVLAAQLKKEQLKECSESISDKKIQIHTTLEEFLSMAFDMKQKQFELPLNKLSEDLEKVLSNMIQQVKEKEYQLILKRNRHNKAVKISSAWKEMFLIATQLRRDELIQIIPAKIKNLKEEQTTIKAMLTEKIFNVNNEGEEIAALWRTIFSDVLSMKIKDIKKIMHLLDDREGFSLEEKKNGTASLDPQSNQNYSSAGLLEKLVVKSEDNQSKTYLSNTQRKQPPKKEHSQKLMKYKEYLKSLEHKRLKQPTYLMSSWNDVIVQAFLILQLEAAEKSIGENGSDVISSNLNSESKFRNVFQREFTWDELLSEANNLVLKGKKLSHLLQTEKEINIPLIPWSNIFSKATHLWDVQINKESIAKQNENILMNWETKMDPKEHAEFVTACNYKEQTCELEKSQNTGFSESSIFSLSKSMNMSYDLKQLKETLSRRVFEESSTTDNPQHITIGWDDMFQDFETVIKDSNALVDILKNQDLKTQYQAARIHSSWNDYFIKTVKHQKEEFQKLVLERTMQEKVSKNIHGILFEESQEACPPPMTELSESWTDEAIEVLKNQKNELLHAVVVKEREMKEEKAPSKIELKARVEDNPLLNTEPEKLVAQAKQMFTLALNLRRAELKAMENELKEIRNSEVCQEDLVTQLSKSINIWRKIIFTAVDCKKKGMQLKHSNKNIYTKSSEQLFFSASKNLMKELDCNSNLGIKKENINVGLMDKSIKLPTWDMLFQTTSEIVLNYLEKTEIIGHKEAVFETDNNDIDILHWTDIFIGAVEQKIKEMNPDQIDLHALFEQEISNQALPSWNEIFFIMSNYSKHGIEEKLNSDASCTIADNDDLLNIKLLVSHNSFSWDNLVIAVIEEFLKEIENSSDQPEFEDSTNFMENNGLPHSYKKGENMSQPEYFFSGSVSAQKKECSWIDFLPTKEGAKRYEAKDNLLVDKIKLLHPNSVYKHEKIPNDIMWKHLFPLAVLLWRKTMSNYLNFNNLPYQDFCFSKENQELITEIVTDENLKRHSTIKSTSNFKFENIQKLNPEYFSINVSWREIFFAAVERKRKILCQLINLKGLKSGKLDPETSPNSLKEAEFSVNKVLDLPITPCELVEAFKVLKSKQLILYNERSGEYIKQTSENKVAPLDDIEPSTVIEKLSKILSNGMDLRTFEISILRQELEKIENYSKKNHMVSNTIETIRKYYYGAKGYRKNENKKIDEGLESLKDAKDMFSEYVDYSMDNSIYQQNKQQCKSMQKMLQNLQKIQSDFEQKLTVHLERCVSDCKILIKKRTDPHLKMDLKTVDILLEKPKLKNMKLLNDAKSILIAIADIRKRELENFENELELTKKKDTVKDFLESKVFNILSSVSTVLFDALCQRNHLLEMLTNSIDNIKQIVSNMDTRRKNAFACCKDLFSKAKQKINVEIATLKSEISIFKTNLNCDHHMVFEVLSCEHFIEKAASKRNAEIQLLDIYLEQLPGIKVSDCHSNCIRYFSTASEKRNVEIQEIEGLMEPLKKMENGQEKDSELSSALDEALYNVFGIEPDANKTQPEKSKTDETILDAKTLKKLIDLYSKLQSSAQNEIKEIRENLKILERFKDAIEEEPIQLLRNFIKCLENNAKIIETEIEALQLDVKIFKTNQDVFETQVNNVQSVCHKYLTESLENANKELEEIRFQLKILSNGENESNPIKMYAGLQYTEAKQTFFDGLGPDSESDDTQQLSTTSCTEVSIKIIQVAMKWRNVSIKTLVDEIKFLLDSNHKPLQILNSCKEIYFSIRERRKEELGEILKVLDEQANKEVLEASHEECFKELIYINNHALNIIEDELVRLTHIFKILYKEKNDIFSMCEQLITDVIYKRTEEIKVMNSELSHLQIMGLAEETESLSHCKKCLQNAIEERESELKILKSDSTHWPLETEILPIVISCGKHLFSCLEKKENEVQYILKLLKSLKEEGSMSILLYSPTLESIVEKNNSDCKWLQPEVSKFAYIQNELEIKGKRIVEACHKLYFYALENLKIELEGLLQDAEYLQEVSVENSKTEVIEGQEAVVSFSHLFMTAFNLKKLELGRNVRQKDIQDDIQRKKMDIVGVGNHEVFGPDNVSSKSAPFENKKKNTIYEVTSLTQLNPYFDRLKKEKGLEMKAKVLEEFKDLEQKLTFGQEILLQIPPSSEKEIVADSKSSSDVETFTNRVYEIKVKQIEDEINFKRKKIKIVIMERKSRMEDLMETKRQEMEELVLSKERQIRHMIDSVQNENSQVVCSLKDIFCEIVELKNAEEYTLKDVKQLDHYKDKELEAQNVLVNLDNIFSVALKLKEEEIDMLKHTNFKDIERKILIMKKESEKIVANSQIQLEEALQKYREHEKERALIYTGVTKTSIVSKTEEYEINEENIFPDIKAFENYIETFDIQAKKKLYCSNDESEKFSKDTSLNIPFIRPYTYALHGAAGHLLKLCSDEVQSLSKVLYDITTEIQFAMQHGISFKTAERPTNVSVVPEKVEIHPDIVAILNTNTSMLMLGSFMDNKCNVALNLGNEFGLVYFEQKSKVEKWICPNPTAKEISIDVGLAHFTFKGLLDKISTKFDWDVTSLPFCCSRFQRFISDTGLLEQIRFVLLDLHHLHLFCRNCDLGYLSNDTGLKFEEISKFLSTRNRTDALQPLPIKCTAFLSNDVDVALYAIKLVLIRGALLTSICIASLLEGIERQSISIITNSLFIQEISEYQSYIKTFISKLAPGKEIEFLFSNGVSCGFGAALAACVTFELNNHNPENLLFEFQALLKQKSQLFHISDFIKLLENKGTFEKALKLAYKYLEELKFNLPISVAWAHYFMKEQYNKAEKLFKESPVSLKKVQFLISQQIHLTGNLELCKMFKEFVKKHCSDRRLIAKVFRCLFDSLVSSTQYEEAMSLVQDIIKMNMSLSILRYSSLIKLHDFWLKNSSKFENVSTFSLPLQETYSSGSDSE